MKRNYGVKALVLGVLVVLAVSLIPLASATVTVYSTDILDLPKYGTTIVFTENNVFDDAYREEDGNSTYPSMWFFTNSSVTYGLCPEEKNINVTEISTSGFKYTKSGVGVEKFYAASTPSEVKIDLAVASTGWNYSSGLITVTSATSEVEFSFAAIPTPTPDENTGGYTPGGGSSDTVTPTPSGDGGPSPTPSPPLEGGFDLTTGVIIVCAGILVALLVTRKDEKQRRTKRGPLVGSNKMPKEKPIFR